MRLAKIAWPMSGNRRPGSACGLVTKLAVGLALLAPLPAAADALQDVRTGTEAFKSGQLNEAIEAFTAAITSGDLGDETLAITYNNRGVARGELNEFDRAIDDYRKALTLLPNDPITRKNLRVAHLKRAMDRQAAGDLVNAEADLDAAVAAQPDHYLPYLRRAELNVSRGQLALAVVDYEQALALNPNNPALAEALDRARLARDGGATPTIATETPNETAAASEQAPQATNTDPLQAAPGQSPAAANEPADTLTAEPSPAPATTATTPETTAAVAPAQSIEPSAGPGERMRTVADVNVRSGAGNTSPVVTTIAGSVEVSVIGEELGWKNVILPDGTRGYIYQSWLEPITP